MSSPRYVGRRRRPSRMSRIGTLPSAVGSNGARAAAKTVAGVGIVLGSAAFVVTPSQAGGVSTAAADSVASNQADVESLFADREGEPGTSRSTTRVAAALTAPDGSKAKDVHEEAGAIAVEPIAKPKPKPKPKPVEKPEETEQVDEAAETEQVDEAAETEQADEAPEAGTEEVTETREQSAPSRSQERSAPSSSTSSSQSQSSGAPATGNYGAQGAALGLGPNAQRVYSAVRTQFPDMTNIGGYRAGDPGDHGSGNAVDIMVTGARGDQVASWVQANAGSLNVKYVIWKQRIWLPGSGWRAMEDRGDPTQNHFDHVHVSVN